MKYTTIIGVLLIAMGIVAAFVGKVEFGNLITESSFALGILFGGGIGLLLGGFLGWLYKKPYENKNSSKQTPTDSKQNP
ncbi:hypothetical protein [Moheibacter stercoris]|uniref:Uncharacterized membrane protein YciS (DUF1049 family) n=1 Tax=Moheibacter stercoris TaxID=1628251 RepID=A0ABV2LSL3_9FLAO